jgi:Tol biopolymer transport system component
VADLHRAGQRWSPHRLLNEDRNAGDPSWSPDGESLVFGRINDIMGKEAAERTLQILNLGTHHLDTVPNSKGLFSPRWSPDGRYIAALSLDQRQVRLYSFGDRTWRALPVDSGADPVWSSDSRFIYIHARLDAAQPIDRISIPEGRVEQVIRLADPGHDGAVDFVFGGLTPDNRPLIRERIFTGNFYSLDLSER